MSVLIGLDPSPLRLGWAAVDTDTAQLVAWGCDDIALPHGGWQDHQIAEALRRIARTFQSEGVEVWCREEPMTPHVRTAKAHGYTCGLVDSVARRVFPDAMVVSPIGPTEWRRIIGLPGNAPKHAVMEWAGEYVGGRGQVHSQDAADALAVAHAAWLEWTRMEEA